MLRPEKLIPGVVHRLQTENRGARFGLAQGCANRRRYRACRRRPAQRLSILRTDSMRLNSME
jgi:hypothetical protein